MTERLFWKDAYAKEFDAKVTAVRENAIVLDQTLFFPEGGGQVGDVGTIGGIRVTDTKKEGDDILHLVEDASSFSVGQKVHGAIDWERRYKTMRLHTAAHVGFFALREFDNQCSASSGRVDEEKERSDYTFTKELTPEAITAAEARANEIISRNLDVEIWFEESEGAAFNPWTRAPGSGFPAGLRRKWRIEGFESMDCGGTHVKNTSEIGRVAMSKGKNPGGGKKRIEIRLVI
ncbi:Alanyl-tRNA editing protein AlaX-M [Candidatus Norongarragalina meridionalis]|nr:Alanyl-tRNA editing protein AlaX-M [Candidatus Norongarragalina meridionalis]